MLSNKRILITGANGGIGISIAELLLKNGANVVLLYHNKKNKIEDLQTNNKELHHQIESHKTDLMNSVQLKETLDAVLKNGEVGIFVHSPTLPIVRNSVGKMNWNDYQSHIDLQTKSFLQISQSLIPSMMKKKSGKLINILTSYTAGVPPSELSHYITAKYSLLGLSKALAVELGPYGISINSVSPSMTNTPLIENLPTKLKEITSLQVPMRRLGEPRDVASTVLFLCSECSDFITGENILVAGGHVMH